METPDTIAADIMKLSRSVLMMKMRFMNVACCELKLEPSDSLSFATNMKTLWYNPRHILRRYSDSTNLPSRDFLHVVMHGVLCHAFVGASIDRSRWNLACDIAVEAAISDLPIGEISDLRKDEQQKILSHIKKQLHKPPTAERVYRFLMSKSSAWLKKTEKAFYADNHAPWYSENARAITAKTSDSTHKRWQKISKHVQADLGTFSWEFGTASGNFTKNLREANREKYDYTAFLRKFAILGEVMRVNPDEFDYVYYTHGLRLYGNLPLIEPLEYREERRIKDFVIAIDTSGSVIDELVHKFLNKTYNILQQSETFFTKINIHIIQCDASIQNDYKITSQEQFAKYLQTMELHGGGGTDFRPVFSHVDKLLQKREFSNLRGLIYFTDGYGEFPAKKPPYETAFVFVREDYEPPQAPPWAIKLVLEDGL
jgi:predicted metal-dependent peptidase